MIYINDTAGCFKRRIFMVIRRTLLRSWKKYFVAGVSKESTLELLLLLLIYYYSTTNQLCSKYGVHLTILLLLLP